MNYNIDSHLRYTVSFQGHTSKLSHQSREGRRDCFASHESTDMVLVSGQSQTQLKAEWDVPSHTEHILCKELDLTMTDKDGNPNLQVTVRRDKQNQSFLSVINPSSEGSSTVAVKLPGLEQADECLREGYFSSPDGVKSVRVSLYKLTGKDQILETNGIEINGKLVSFYPANSNDPLLLPWETDPVMAGPYSED